MFCRKHNVRVAVNSSEKKTFHRKAPASFCDECGESGEFTEDFWHLAVIFLRLAVLTVNVSIVYGFNR